MFLLIYTHTHTQTRAHTHMRVHTIHCILPHGSFGLMSWNIERYSTQAAPLTEWKIGLKNKGKANGMGN